MRRSLVAITLLAAVACGGDGDERALETGVPIPSSLRVPENRVNVLLPEGYASGCERYPVLYLLHGAGDTYMTWVDNTDVEEFARGFPLIVVMPDGGHDEEAGWYSDWLDDSRDWETFHTSVLVDWVDSAFRTRGDGHRAIAGLSMGGFGAMSYAARHPGLYQAAASFSGAVDTTYLAPLSGVFFEALHPYFGTPDDRIWGDQLTNGGEWRRHNPTDRAADLRGVALFLATGMGTPGGPAGDDLGNPGGYAIEQFGFQLNLSFARALTLAGVPYEADFYLGGYHGWPYWERELHWALPKIVNVIGREAPCD